MRFKDIIVILVGCLVRWGSPTAAIFADQQAREVRCSDVGDDVVEGLPTALHNLACELRQYIELLLAEEDDKDFTVAACVLENLLHLRQREVREGALVVVAVVVVEGEQALLAAQATLPLVVPHDQADRTREGFLALAVEEEAQNAHNLGNLWSLKGLVVVMKHAVFPHDLVLEEIDADLLEDGLHIAPNRPPRVFINSVREKIEKLLADAAHN